MCGRADAGREHTATCASHQFPTAGSARQGTPWPRARPWGSLGPAHGTLPQAAQIRPSRWPWRAGTHRSQLVKAGKELVEGHDQLLGSALGCQAGEALDVSKQDAGETGGGGPQ